MTDILTYIYNSFTFAQGCAICTSLSAIFIALTAMLIAWLNFYRAHMPYLVLLDYQNGFKVSSENRRIEVGYIWFKFMNCGIPLRNLSLKISGMAEGGERSIELHRLNAEYNTSSDVNNILEKGMPFIFGLKSYELEEFSKNILFELGSGSTSKLRIDLFSGGFLIYTFPFKTSVFKTLWNLSIRLIWKCLFSRPCWVKMPLYRELRRDLFKFAKTIKHEDH